MDEKKKLENYLEFRIPVKNDTGWKNFRLLPSETKTHNSI